MTPVIVTVNTYKPDNSISVVPSTVPDESSNKPSKEENKTENTNVSDDIINSKSKVKIQAGMIIKDKKILPFIEYFHKKRTNIWLNL